MEPIVFIAEIKPGDYPKSFTHIGDHIKATRLDLDLTKKQAAQRIGVSAATVSLWESRGVADPAIQHWPGIITFLGYCPYVPCVTLPEKVAMWRKLRGIDSQQLAATLQVDQGTYLKFEARQILSKGTGTNLTAKVIALLKEGAHSEDISSTIVG